MYTSVQTRDIRLLAALRGVSFLGDAVALVTLYLRLAHGGHAWAIASLSIAATLPLVLLSPVAGVVVDRLSAKRLLTALGLAEALICVAIGYWHALDVTILLMLALSSLVAFSFPGYSALVPFIAGDENIAHSQSLMQAVQGVANIMGPVLGGLLVGWFGQSWPLYLDAVSYGFCALGTTMLRHDRRPVERSREHTSSEGMMAGVLFIWRDGLMRPLQLTVMVFLLSMGMVNVAEVFFATRALHATAVLYGMIGASFGAGTVAGSLWARRLRQDLSSLARTGMISVAIVGFMIGVVGLVERIYLVFPLMAVAGVAVGVVNVAYITLFTLRTPEALRGRMFAATGALLTGSEIGATALGGLILTLVAPRTVFQIGGVASTLSVIVLGPLALRAGRAVHAREADQGA